MHGEKSVKNQDSNQHKKEHRNEYRDEYRDGYRINKGKGRTKIGMFCLLLSGFMWTVSGASSAVSVVQAADETDGTEVDYILDRPMTEEEITEQQNLEPELNEYVEDTGVLPSLEEENQEEYSTYVTSAQSAGSSYDARNDGIVTAAKAQGDYNTCWAFATVSQAETSLLKQGATVNGSAVSLSELDLSEWQLSYFFYHHTSNAYGDTSGDATTNLTNTAMQQGGNNTFTTFELANWVGVADESVADYDTVDDSEGALDSSLEYEDMAHLENAYWIKMTDTDAVKAAIKEYGSVSVSMRYSNTYLNYSTGAYYYGGSSTSVNHTVTLIGWDDNYAASNFKSGARPSSNGAWLVKNSYGSDWLASEAGDDGGYFWLSYEDTNMTKTSAKSFAYEFASADKYDHNYQYDGSAGAYIQASTSDTGYYVASGSSIADIYTAVCDNETKIENLQAVSFAVYTLDVNYSIQIYQNLTDAADPTSGTAMLTEPKTGTTSFTGYYTVDLGENIALAEGDTFSVVITLSKSDNSDISYFVDKTYTNGTWVSFTSNTNPGESFCYDNGWVDLNDQAVCARIKAFTSDYILQAESLSLDQTEKSLELDEGSIQLQASTVPANATIQKFDWTSSDETIATVDENGLVTLAAPGTVTITATATDGSGVSASCILHITQIITDLSLASYEGTLAVGETYQLNPVVEPSNATNQTLTYQSEDEKVLSVSESGMITALAEGSADITATATDGSELSVLYHLEVTAKSADSGSGEDGNSNNDDSNNDDSNTGDSDTENGEDENVNTDDSDDGNSDGGSGDGNTDSGSGVNDSSNGEDAGANTENSNGDYVENATEEASVESDVVIEDATKTQAAGTVDTGDESDISGWILLLLSGVILLGQSVALTRRL